MGKTNQKGRSTKGRFLSVPHNIYDSLAFKSLLPASKVVFMEFRRRYNGNNNGKIILSAREASKAIKPCAESGSTGDRALKQLMKHGFIKVHNKGHFRNRHASTWILTSEVFEGRAPTYEWREYEKNSVP